jgi:hypothetical protein
MELTQFQVENAAQKSRELGGGRAQKFYLKFAQSMTRDAAKTVQAKAALDSALTHGQLLTQEDERIIMLALNIRKYDLEWDAATARAMAATIDPMEQASVPPSAETLDMYSKYCGEDTQ